MTPPTRARPSGNLVVGLMGYGVSVAMWAEDGASLTCAAIVLDPGKADDLAHSLQCLAAEARDALDNNV